MVAEQLLELVHQDQRPLAGRQRHHAEQPAERLATAAQVRRQGLAASLPRRWVARGQALAPGGVLQQGLGQALEGPLAGAQLGDGPAGAGPGAVIAGLAQQAAQGRLGLERDGGAEPVLALQMLGQGQDVRGVVDAAVDRSRAVGRAGPGAASAAVRRPAAYSARRERPGSSRGSFRLGRAAGSAGCCRWRS